MEKLNVLHVTIRSIKRNFENLKGLLEECELVFNIICVSETWSSNTKLQNNSNLSLTGFDSLPYERSKKNRGGGVLIFIKKNISYKIRKDLSESKEHKEILSCCYKPPKGDSDILSRLLKQVFKKSTAEKKPYYLIGDLNINCLEYFENEKVSTFYNSLFECGAIVLINKPSRAARKSATVIDNTNIFNESLKRGIIKSDLSDHLPIFFSVSTSKLPQNSSPLKLKKRFFNESNLASFKNQISNINWDTLNSTQCGANSLYENIPKYF